MSPLPQVPVFQDQDLPNTQVLSFLTERDRSTGDEWLLQARKPR